MTNTTVHKMSSPNRHGQPWSQEEIQQLLQEVRKKETFDDIAIKHQRSKGSIRARLRQLAADYYFNDNRPIDEIIKFTGLDAETIADAISKRQYQMDIQEKKEKQKEKVQTVITTSNDTSITLLNEIRDMMKEMLEIMKRS